MALAYFITFSTYGTWLHGSGKGSVDRDHREFGSPLIAPNDALLAEANEVMTQPEYIMTESERSVVCQAIRSLATEKGWHLSAVHVRTNHVHVVISADREPGRLMTDMKARASRDLNRMGFDSSDRKRWTRHGSTRHLFQDDHVRLAVEYVLNEQGDRMAWYAWEEFSE